MHNNLRDRIMKLNLTTGLCGLAITVVMTGSAMAQSLPNHIEMLNNSQINGNGAQQGNFYSPPQEANPVKPPKTIIETQEQAQATTRNGQPAPPPLPPGVTGVNFSAALANQLPVTPQEIITYRKKKQAVDIARSEMLGPPPAAGSRSVMMSFEPSQKPIVIHLYPGNITSLTFADDTGAPWPITNVIVGDKSHYSVIYTKGKTGSNVMTLDPLVRHAEFNNMAVLLKGASAPLMFSLKTGGRHLDDRIDVNVEAPGPNALPEVTPTSTLPAPDDTLMQQFVDGVPPPHAVQLHTSSASIQGWLYQGDYFLRTRATLFGLNTGKGGVDISNSVGGVHVYRISPTPVVTMSSDGALSRVMISSP